MRKHPANLSEYVGGLRKPEQTEQLDLSFHGLHELFGVIDLFRSYLDLVSCHVMEIPICGSFIQPIIEHLFYTIRIQ